MSDLTGFVPHSKPPTIGGPTLHTSAEFIRTAPATETSPGQGAIASSFGVKSTAVDVLQPGYCALVGTDTSGPQRVCATRARRVQQHHGDTIGALRLLPSAVTLIAVQSTLPLRKLDYACQASTRRRLSCSAAACCWWNAFMAAGQCWRAQRQPR